MFKRFVLAFAILGLAAASAATYRVTLSQPSKIEGKQLQAGEYRLNVAESKLTIVNGKLHRLTAGLYVQVAVQVDHLRFIQGSQNFADSDLHAGHSRLDVGAAGRRFDQHQAVEGSAPVLDRKAPQFLPRQFSRLVIIAAEVDRPLNWPFDRDERYPGLQEAVGHGVTDGLVGLEDHGEIDPGVYQDLSVPQAGVRIVLRVVQHHQIDFRLSGRSLQAAKHFRAEGCAR